VKGKSVLAGREEREEPEEQKELPGTAAAADNGQPKSVRDGKMLAKYVRPHYDKDSKDAYVVGLEFSFPLTKDHEKLIPPDVAHSWKSIKSGRNGRKIVDIDVDPHVVHIYLAPDDKPYLSLLFALITNANLALIEETGSGKATDVIRYSFRIQHPSEGSENENLREFADTHFEKQVWLKMEVVQGSLLKAYQDEQEEEAEKE
jgi:hypothetical protein